MKTLLVSLLIYMNPYSHLIDLCGKLLSKYNVPNKEYVVLIDYSKPMTEERLFVIRTCDNQIVIKSKVTHGVNSGELFATDFSNENNSLKSSLGAFQTTTSYYGNYGLSLSVVGLDKDINSNAEKRKIVFHSTKKMKTNYSWGCFATPDSINEKLIPLIKGGCLVYVYK